ncbi:MAG: hypothetical protein JJ903_04945 [Spongiibacter sp.]|uniref:hypothetical protein n=1 Tax=Spongiibacter sp. TaxID=2024860 RepID=UPI001B06B4D1|nr:hypothetical protein [Spongiibacter sp.]MBO6752410.1 hypothetical protein [Spongiibacter sp.]
MNSVDTPRAKLVELLWQLKTAMEQGSNRRIHFNSLLRDSAYRRELIDEAATSQQADLRELGLSLRVLNSDGELTQRDAGVNPDITETVSAGSRPTTPSGGQQRSALWAVVALILLAIAAGIVLLDNGPRPQTVQGSLRGTQHWDADTLWRLKGIVYLEGNAQLSIEAGTVIQGEPGSALIVTRDATLTARGTADAPIVFTSAQAAGQRQAGDWGGLVLLGNAPVNSGEAQIEGLPMDDRRGRFGGGDTGSHCGVLDYVRIEFAGYEVYANNELNGLTLGGCGNNTIVRHVQVHRAADDGIEVFGGTVDLQRVVISGADDDSLDWDMGWTGRVQFMQILQYPQMGDNAIEADNSASDHAATPVSAPTLYNVSLLSLSSSEKFQRGITLRRGSGGHFHNMLISGFSGEAIDIRDIKTVSRFDSEELSFSAMAIVNNGPYPDEQGKHNDDGGFDEARFFAELALTANPGLAGLSADDPQPDFRIAAGSPLGQGASALPQGEFWDEAAEYIGALRPGSTKTWLDGWTQFPSR